MTKTGFVYIMSNYKRTVLYIGVTNDIEREKQLKNWHKNWKWNLIQQENPTLHDLATDWYDVEMIKENISE